MREKIQVTNFHIRISPEDKSKLVSLAAQAGKTASEFIRDFIHQATESTQITGQVTPHSHRAAA